MRLPALFTVRCEKIQEQVDVAALCSDEHGIALEGKHTDLEQWRPDLVKRIERWRVSTNSSSGNVERNPSSSPPSSALTRRRPCDHCLNKS